MVDMPKVKTTLEEYMDMEETNHIVEFIEGEVIETPPPLDVHQKIAGRVVGFVGQRLSVETLRIAPTGLRLGKQFFEPDIFWVSPDNNHCALVDGKYWEGAPDFVVEILSKSTEYRDRGIKYETYQRHGVREYWLVEPLSKFIEVYVLAGSKFDRLGIFGRGTTFDSPVLGTTVEVSSVLGA